MEKKQVEDIKKIIAEILEVDVDEIELKTDLVEDLDADSMMALEVMANIEKKFKIRIPEDEIENFETLESIIKITETEMV